MEISFLATLWAKMLIITVNFENKTKVLVKILDDSYSEALALHETLALALTQLFKSRKQRQSS